LCWHRPLHQAYIGRTMQVRANFVGSSSFSSVALSATSGEELGASLSFSFSERHFVVVKRV
jgi:hypothetical protein